MTSTATMLRMNMWNTEDRISCCGNRTDFNCNQCKLNTTGETKNRRNLNGIHTYLILNKPQILVWIQFWTYSTTIFVPSPYYYLIMTVSRVAKLNCSQWRIWFSFDRQNETWCDLDIKDYIEHACGITAVFSLFEAIECAAYMKVEIGKVGQ